jgi:hypothetical protein
MLGLRHSFLESILCPDEVIRIDIDVTSRNLDSSQARAVEWHMVELISPFQLTIVMKSVRQRCSEAVSAPQEILELRNVGVWP